MKTVPALDKGLRILEYFTNISEPKTMTQIAKGIGYNVSEIQRILEHLVNSSYLIKNNVNAYYLSSKLFRITNQNKPQKHLILKSIAPMERFSEKTGESIHISVLIDYQVNIIGQTEGLGISRLILRLGTYPAHRSTSGILLLSTKEHLNFDMLNLKSTEDRDFIEKQIQKMRKQDYGFNKSFYTAGVFDLAVPVKLKGIGTIAALATSFLMSIDVKNVNDLVEKYLKSLIEAADEISNNFEKQ